MQSFFTILIAAMTACAAMFMLSPEPVTETVTLVSAEMPDVPEPPLPDTGLPSFLIVAQHPLIMAFETGAAYDGTLDIAVDSLGAIQD